MKKSFIIVGVLLFTVLLIIMVWVSSSNTEIKLRSTITAQKEVVEAYADKLWKVVAQKAQVADQYREAFKDIYPELIEGRYGNEKGGTLMKWIQESNPNFDIGLYKDLANSIEAERAGFFMEQKKLVDLNNEHRIIKSSFPNSLFIGHRPDIEIKIISSARTKQLMQTAEENDIQIFKK